MASEKDILRKYVQGHPSGKGKDRLRRHRRNPARQVYRRRQIPLRTQKQHYLLRRDLRLGRRRCSVTTTYRIPAGIQATPMPPQGLTFSPSGKIPGKTASRSSSENCSIREGGPSAICPRQLLKQLNAQAEKMGFAAVFSQEIRMVQLCRDTTKRTR